MNYNDIDYANKKNKWTIMKYVASFDLLLDYVEIIRKLNFQVDDKSIDLINREMQEKGYYNPKRGPSKDTTYFKIIQICNNMLAYRGKNNNIVFTPLCNLLLEHRHNIEEKGKITATMLANLPYNHPYNKMDDSFNIFPYRLIYKLLLDNSLSGKIYEDELFYLIAWTKSIDKRSYDVLVNKIIKLREMPYELKYQLFTETLPIQDSLANSLHETNYLFRQLNEAGIINITEGDSIGVLCHGGFGRSTIPNTLEEAGATYKPTGRRKYKTSYITLKTYIVEYIQKLLNICDYTEKPHDIYEELGTDDYILKLYNFYPAILLRELGISETSRNKINFILDLVNNIKKYSKNSTEGDYHRFEDTICDAFNEFIDVEANTIAKSGTTDVECIYLTLSEKFDVEAKSTSKKLSSINAGRLKSHRNKIGSKYTIIIAPKYVPSALLDIKETDNVILTVNSLCNFLYQSSIKSKDISYQPLYDIICKNKGTDISGLLNYYVAATYGIKQGPNAELVY